MKKIVILILFFLSVFVTITSTSSIKIVTAGGCNTCLSPNDDCTICYSDGTQVSGFCVNKADGSLSCRAVGGGGGGGGGGGATTGKCTCTAAYGACGNYLGQTYIKYRRCTANLAGVSTCTIIDGSYYNYVSCSTTATPTTPPASNKCTCSGAYSACGNYLQRTNVMYRQCTGSTTGTTNCEKVGGIFYDVVSCSAPTVTPPTATRTPTPGGPTITPGGATPAFCHYCSTAACGQCSNFAPGWRCKCTGFNGSVYNSCKGELDSTCGVAQPTPTGVPAGMCARCTTAECDQCSTYASGWRCKCSGQQGNYYTTCEGKLDTTCGVAQATPTPAACPQKIFGDADCDNNVTLKDYFYYVAKKAGVTLPTTVNVDFNASGTVDDADRNIVVKTIKP